jgi:hypothetical protein
VKYEVGKKVYLVYHWRPSSNCAAEVTEVSRRWATIRVDPSELPDRPGGAELRVLLGTRAIVVPRVSSSVGDVWETEDEYRRYREARLAWAGVVEDIRALPPHRCPGTDAIRKAREILGLAAWSAHWCQDAWGDWAACLLA